MHTHDIRDKLPFLHILLQFLLSFYHLFSFSFHIFVEIFELVFLPLCGQPKNLFIIHWIKLSIWTTFVLYFSIGPHMQIFLFFSLFGGRSTFAYFGNLVSCFKRCDNISNPNGTNSYLALVRQSHPPPIRVRFMFRIIYITHMRLLSRMYIIITCFVLSFWWCLSGGLIFYCLDRSSVPDNCHSESVI